MLLQSGNSAEEPTSLGSAIAQQNDLQVAANEATWEVLPPPKKRTSRVHYSITFEGDIEHDTDEELESLLDAIGPTDVWNDDKHVWEIDHTNRRIIDSWDNDNTDDTEEDD